MSEAWPLVAQCSDHCFKCAKNAAQGKCDQHEEEKCRPNLRSREKCDNLRVDNECKSRPTCLHHSLYSESIGVRHEAKDGKNNQSGKQRRDRVREGNEDRILVAI